MAVTAQSIWLSPFGVRLNFVVSNPGAAVRFSDPLPGVANSFTGADPRQWVTGIPRYGAALLADVYPGIDAQYVVVGDGQLMLRLVLRAGVEPERVVFEVPQAVSVGRNPDGSLRIALGNSRYDPALTYAPPVAFQQSASGPVERSVSYAVQPPQRFGFAVEGRDSSLPLQLEIKLAASAGATYTGATQTADAAGNIFVTASVPDAAGKDGPFPAGRWEACGQLAGSLFACSDVAIYKFSKAGELIFVSYLAGKTRESPSFLRLAPDGALLVTGTTDSSDFPVTPAALQSAYAGPAPLPATSSGAPVYGDFFAVRLDASAGIPRAATFLGGPKADSAGETAVGPDGSVYFLPKSLTLRSAGLPVTPGALLPECPADPCTNGYAARLSPSLDRLLYGTYLPGIVQTSGKLHSDGSVYYAGAAGPGFPATPAAYQGQPAGKEDGIVARLDPSGSRLLFATYLGGVETDWVLNLAVAPDGSVWAALSSFVQCCVNIQYRLVRLDASLARLLSDKPIDVGDLAVDREGNLIATAFGQFTVGPDAFLKDSCGWSRLAYLKLRPNGEQVFSTYLPAGADYEFDGTSEAGSPLLRIRGQRFEVVESRSMGVYAGCVVDAASFDNTDTLSPGAIVTLFGSRMGPPEGVAFQLQDGRVPVSLGGTRVLVNGEPVPVLFASYWQVNVILPYSLEVATFPRIQVESNGSAGNVLGSSLVRPAGISVFRLDPALGDQAAALNEDGTVNSARNPARKGSRVALFGTGGGATIPPSVAGEVTPLELRLLTSAVQVQIVGLPPAAAGPPLVTVEYAGAAPGLVAGATQINIKLPEVIPEIPGFPRGTLPLRLETPGGVSSSGWVTVAVTPDVSALHSAPTAPSVSNAAPPGPRTAW